MFRPFMQSSPILSRNFSSCFNFFKKWGSQCCKKKVEICPSEPKSQKYVIAKSCCKSIFETWKPKVPDLEAPPLPTIQTELMAPYKHKSCKAGMKFREPDRCKNEAYARECQKMNHPKWIMKCPKLTVEQLGPLPVMKEAVLKCKESKGQTKSEKKKNKKLCDTEVPKGDWNPDGKF